MVRLCTEDYTRFPLHVVANATSTFNFQQPSAEIRRRYASVLDTLTYPQNGTTVTQGFATFLEKTDTVAQYLEEKMWQPLGMEAPSSWSLDSEQSGFEKMESGINGRAIDFAKFWRLFLNQGNWNGA